MMPAPPVPDDHVDSTFLLVGRRRHENKRIRTIQHINDKCIHFSAGKLNIESGYAHICMYVCLSQRCVCIHIRQIHIDMQYYTYLLYCEEYARKVTSPNPRENDVQITPRMACHSASANAISKNPVTCSVHVSSTRKLDDEKTE